MQFKSPLTATRRLSPSPTPNWTNDTPTRAANDFAVFYNLNGAQRATFPDANQLVNLGPDYVLGPNGDYTLECWVKLPLGFTPTERGIMFTYEGAPGFAFSINTGRTLQRRIDSEHVRLPCARRIVDPTKRDHPHAGLAHNRRKSGPTKCPGPFGLMPGTPLVSSGIASLDVNLDAGPKFYRLRPGP